MDSQYKWTNDLLDCVGKGWRPLVEALVNDLIALGWDQETHCVKEKFGGLRFYIGAGSDEVFERIDRAERDSYSICEDCGAKGDLRQRGWWRTLCDGCDKSRVGPNRQG